MDNAKVTYRRQQDRDLMRQFVNEWLDSKLSTAKRYSFNAVIILCVAAVGYIYFTTNSWGR